MKKGKSLLICSLTLCCGLLQNEIYAQNVWPNSGNINVESATLGNVGVGLTKPASMLHLHGLSSYIEQSKDGMAGINYGPSSRLQFTNSTLGSTLYRGFELRHSGFDMYFNNLENRGNIHISAVGTPTMTFHSEAKRIFVGGIFGAGSQLSADHYASYNIGRSNDNGLYVRARQAQHYGIRIESVNEQNALEVMSRNDANNTSTRNFKVTGEGFVFARRYTTTLQNIPDYVFAPTYNLMPLNDLRTYLNTNRHLPNIPSATEMEAEPVDLGELTRLLLEKIEESTLYILQLEERIKALENGQ